MTFSELMDGKILKQNEIVNLAQSEDRALTAEEQNSFNALQVEIDELSNCIKLASNIKSGGSVAAVAPTNNSQPVVYSVDSDEYKNAWLKYTQNPSSAAKQDDIMDVINAVNPVNAMSSSEGLFIPTTIADEIFSLMIESHPILSDVKVLDVKGNFVMNIHTGITANDAKSVPIGDCLEPEENEFASVTLSGYQYGKLVEIPWALRAMNITAWEKYLVEEVSSRLGVKLANDIFYGKGESDREMTGIDPTIRSKNNGQMKTYTNLSYEDLAWAMSKTSLPMGQRYIYVNEETYWGELSAIMDGNKRPLFIIDPASGVFRSAFGYEVRIESSVKNSDIWIGKPGTGYVMNYNQRVNTVVDDEPKCLKTNIIGWCVVDGTVVTTKAWALLTKDSGSGDEGIPTP